MLNLHLLRKVGPVLIFFSDVNFTVSSPLVPCFLSGVNAKPTGILKLFCDHPNLTWNHANNIPSRLLTGITKGPQYAITRNFVKSIQVDMNFSHCLFPYCFPDQIVTSCMGLLIKRPWFIYGNRRWRFFHFIKHRSQNLVRFYFIHRYSLLRTLLPLPRRFCRINAAWSL